jgi:hypothetical protein
MGFNFGKLLRHIPVSGQIAGAVGGLFHGGIKGAARGFAGASRTQAGDALKYAAPLAPGGGMVADLLAKKKAGMTAGGAGGAESLDQEYQDAINAEKAGPTGAGYEGLKGFDPAAAYGTYLGGAQNKFMDILRRSNADITGSAVGRGRLNTGFYNQDIGDNENRIAQDFASEASGAALQTAGMQESKYGTLAGLEGEQRNRYYDLLSGGLDRATANANAKRAEKSSTKNSILGILGDLGSTFLTYKLGQRKRAPGVSGSYGNPPYVNDSSGFGNI